MSAARTAVVPERVRTFTHKMEGSVLPARRTLLDLRHDLGQPSSFLESPGGIRESWSGLREFHDIPRPWRPASGKCCDVVEQMGELLMHAPEVTAITAEICSASEFAREQQEADQLTVARRTLDRRAPAMAGEHRAHTTAPVFNDEEKRARATTQVRKVARERYRFDVGGLAFWAGCDSATTLISRARHVGISWACRTERATEPEAIRAELRPVGVGCKTEIVRKRSLSSTSSDYTRSPGDRGHPGLRIRSGPDFVLCRSGNSGRGMELLHGRGVRRLRKRRDLADHARVVLVHAPHMCARTAVVPEVRVHSEFTRVRQIDRRVLLAHWTRWDRLHTSGGHHLSATAGAVSGNACAASGELLTHGQVLHLLERRGVQLVWKWRDVSDQLPCFLVHAPDVTARATVIVSARAVAQGRQKLDQLTVARSTLRDRRHGKTLESLQPPAKAPALMLRADTTAPVFHDEEKRARATTQIHKVAREGYRFDGGGSAFSAGYDRATTLVAGARHVGDLIGLPHGTCQLSHQ